MPIQLKARHKYFTERQREIREEKRQMIVIHLLRQLHDKSFQRDQMRNRRNEWREII